MVNAGRCLFASVLLVVIGDALSVNPTDGWLGRKAKVAQYHTQDPSSGAYQYGYSGPHHAKSESSINGVTRGGYSYIDANGLMQTVSYTADAENGFRVHASNLPNQNSPVEDTPEVALAKKRHLEQVRRAESWHESSQPDQSRQAIRRNYNPRNPYLLTPEEARSIPAPRPSSSVVEDNQKKEGAATPRQLAFVTHQQHYVVPTVYAMALPLIHTSMRHTQDSLGQYEYSYTGDTSAKTESRSLDGTTRGAYSYIDANGLLQQVHYIADRDGFRVLATNLPEA